MTVPRTAGSVESVLLDAIHRLSPQDIKEATGKTQAHFYKVSQPGDRRSLQLEDAANLDAALILAGLPPRFHPLMEALTAAKINGKATGVCLHHALRGAMICVGDLAREIDRAFEDGRLDLHERRAIAGQAQALMDVAQQIRDEVEPPYDKPTEVA